jgi:hypothetical protein
VDPDRRRSSPQASPVDAANARMLEATLETERRAVDVLA